MISRALAMNVRFYWDIPKVKRRGRFEFRSGKIRKWAIGIGCKEGELVVRSWEFVVGSWELVVGSWELVVGSS